jgi:MFS transporter, DHA2 family, multidrug resistance protein
LRPAKQPLTPLHGTELALAALGVSLATFMQVLDTTIANVCVPTIAGSLGMSSQQGVWVITSFGVSSAISMPLTGRLAERFGQVRLFTYVMTLFVIASFLCGIAPNMQLLVAARVLHGAVAGPLMPLSQSLILAIYPQEKRGHALALWSTIAVVAPIVGPILGGLISDNASWPWIFFINIPVGAVALILVYTTLHGMESERRRPPLDLIGLLLLAGWVGALQVFLDLGTDENWFDSNLIIALALCASIGFLFFLIWEFGEAHPIVDLSLFRNRNFVVGVIGGGLMYGTFFGSTVLLPLVLQTQLGYTATWAGLVLAPVGILPVLTARIVGRNMQRWDPRVMITGSLITIAIVMWMRDRFTTGVDLGTLILPQFVLGLGIVLMSTPMNALTLSWVPSEQTAGALGVSMFTRVAMGSFGASLFTSLWQHREAIHHTRLAEAVTTFSPVTQQAVQTLTDQGLTLQQAYAYLEAALTQQSFMMAADDVFWIAGWFALLLVFVYWFARPPFMRGAAVPVAVD